MENTGTTEGNEKRCGKCRNVFTEDQLTNGFSLFRNKATMWDALRTASEIGDLMLCSRAIVDLNEAGSTLQDIETELRRSECRLRIIALEHTDVRNTKARMLDGTPARYVLWLTTQPTHEESSYADNFSKLPETGFQCVK